MDTATQGRLAIAGQQLRPLALLGEGTYACVLLASICENTSEAKERTSQSRDTAKRLCAIKIFKSKSNEVVRLARREVLAHTHLNGHPNIVHIQGAYRSASGRPILLMEYCPRDLLSELRNHPSGMPSATVKVLAWQLVQALRFVHSRKYLHRDLKPTNLLLTSEGVLKLCDFGLAREASLDCGDKLTSYVITRWYRAPEVLLGKPYGTAADIWSLGCTIAELATGVPLLPGKSTVDQMFHIWRMFGGLHQRPRASANSAGEDHAATAGSDCRKAPHPHSPICTLRFRLGSQLEEPVLELLEAIMRTTPQDRPSAEELLRMPYFAEVPELVTGTPLERLYDWSCGEGAAASPAATAATGGAGGLATAVFDLPTVACSATLGAPKDTAVQSGAPTGFPVARVRRQFDARARDDAAARDPKVVLHGDGLGSASGWVSAGGNRVMAGGCSENDSHGSNDRDTAAPSQRPRPPVIRNMRCRSSAIGRTFEGLSGAAGAGAVQKNVRATASVHKAFLRLDEPPPDSRVEALWEQHGRPSVVVGSGIGEFDGGDAKGQLGRPIAKIAPAMAPLRIDYTTTTATAALAAVPVAASAAAPAAPHEPQFPRASAPSSLFHLLSCDHQQPMAQPLSVDVPTTATTVTTASAIGTAADHAMRLDEDIAARGAGRSVRSDLAGRGCLSTHAACCVNPAERAAAAAAAVRAWVPPPMCAPDAGGPVPSTIANSYNVDSSSSSQTQVPGESDVVSRLDLDEGEMETSDQRGRAFLLQIINFIDGEAKVRLPPLPSRRWPPVGSKDTGYCQGESTIDIGRLGPSGAAPASAPAAPEPAAPASELVTNVARQTAGPRTLPSLLDGGATGTVDTMLATDLWNITTDVSLPVGSPAADAEKEGGRKGDPARLSGVPWRSESEEQEQAVSHSVTCCFSARPGAIDAGASAPAGRRKVVSSEKAPDGDKGSFSLRTLLGLRDLVACR